MVDLFEACAHVSFARGHRWGRLETGAAVSSHLPSWDKLLSVEKLIGHDHIAVA
jgi:hypothetical protein